MGMDLSYVRCERRVLEAAIADLAYARRVMGGVDCVASFDMGRAEDKLYRVLGGARASFRHSDAFDEEDWPGLALAGDDWLHFQSIDTGYGGPRFLSPPTVARIAARLLPIADTICGDDEHLRLNFVPWRQLYLDAGHANHAVIITPS